MKFTKMHGLGNDFMVIDATCSPFLLTIQQIQQLADRHRGVGFDQLLVIEAPQKANTDFHYRIFNADGSEVGQCGNGARCVAKYVQAMGLSLKKELMFSTVQTTVKTQIMSDDLIGVDMGIPSFLSEDLPLLQPQASTYFLSSQGINVEFSAVSIGNPHAVIIVEDLTKTDCAAIGNIVGQHPWFPEGTNVGFMQRVKSNHVHLQVYERGVGLTQACGSGACAAMAVGHKRGLLGSQVTVSQPGGDLQIAWLGESQHLTMVGPAQFVFIGEVTTNCAFQSD